MTVLYLFDFGEFVKLGVAGCLQKRIARGFWHNRHPEELCNKLDDPILLRLWDGDWKIEQALHDYLRFEYGEFSPAERAEEEKSKDKNEFYRAEHTKEITEFIDTVLQPLPLPLMPKITCCKPVKRNCCLERSLDGKTREDHMFRSLATKGKTAPCPKCGKIVSIRNDKLKAHQKSRNCTG